MEKRVQCLEESTLKHRKRAKLKTIKDEISKLTQSQAHAKLVSQIRKKQSERTANTTLATNEQADRNIESHVKKSPTINPLSDTQVVI